MVVNAGAGAAWTQSRHCLWWALGNPLLTHISAWVKQLRDSSWSGWSQPAWLLPSIVVQEGREYSLKGNAEAEKPAFLAVKSHQRKQCPGLGWDCSQCAWFDGEILVIPELSAGSCVKVPQQGAAKWPWEDAAWLELGCGQTACCTEEVAEVGEELLMAWIGVAAVVSPSRAHGQLKCAVTLESALGSVSKAAEARAVPGDPGQGGLQP